jgi:hypothetical protein
MELRLTAIVAGNRRLADCLLAICAFPNADRLTLFPA